MASTDQHVGIDEPYHEGDTLELLVDVDDDGSDKALHQASVDWVLSETPSSTPVLDDSDSGVSATVSNGSAGEVTVTIDAGVTNDLAGHYQHEVRITDKSGDKAVVTEGHFRIVKRFTP